MHVNSVKKKLNSNNLKFKFKSDNSTFEFSENKEEKKNAFRNFQFVRINQMLLPIFGVKSFDVGNMNNYNIIHNSIFRQCVINKCLDLTSKNYFRLIK